MKPLQKDNAHPRHVRFTTTDAPLHTATIARKPTSRRVRGLNFGVVSQATRLEVVPKLRTNTVIFFNFFYSNREREGENEKF